MPSTLKFCIIKIPESFSFKASSTTKNADESAVESWRLTAGERLGSLFSYFDHAVDLTGDVTTTARIGKWQEVTEFP